MDAERRRFCALATGGLAASLVPLPSRAAGMDAPGTTSLEAAETALRLLPAIGTRAWTYNGSFPGPLLRVTRGQALKVRLVNRLAQPTTLCWHGVRLGNAFDGVGGLTQPPVKPGATSEITIAPPDAGLFWYHPHVFPFSAEQIGRGLLGPLIVDEAAPPPVDQDFLLTLADWSLDSEGQITGNFADQAVARGPGLIGRLVTINGGSSPAAIPTAPGSRVRLRILNACAARIALIGIVGAKPTVIALDGQPSELFRPARDMVPLGPGSRCELMLDVPANTRSASVLLHGLDEPDRPLSTFAVEGKPVSPHPPVAKLPDNPRLPPRIPLERAIRRDLVIAPMPDKSGKDSPSPFAWSLGGAPSDGMSGPPLVSVKRGDVVTLGFVNHSDLVQQMHVHGHVFRVLHDLDDGWDPYWRDSILVAPRRTKHVAFVADNPGKWAIESLVLARQVTGLAGWFEVA